MAPYYFSKNIPLPEDMNFMSDELERQLVLIAIEEQFRPHPLRALQAWAGKLMHALRHDAGRPHLTRAHA